MNLNDDKNWMQRSHTAAPAALDAEMEFLQDRPKKLEGGQAA